MAAGEAKLSDLVTITQAGAGLGPATLTFDTTFLLDTMLGETGLAVGGLALVDVRGLLELNYMETFANGSLTGRALMNSVGYVYQSGTNFVAASPSVVASADPYGPLLTPSQRVSVNGGGLTNPILSATMTVNAQTQTIFEARLEIQFTPRVGGTLLLRSTLRAAAFGPAGHVTGADGGNSGYLGLTLPEGWEYTSLSGALLTEAATPPAVPLPAGGALPGAAMGLRLRRISPSAGS